MTGIKKAIDVSGSAAALSRSIGVSKMAVCHWKKNGLPLDRVMQVFAATGVTPHELRPDFYPNPTDGLPPQEK